MKSFPETRPSSSTLARYWRAGHHTESTAPDLFSLHGFTDEILLVYATILYGDGE
jgi:hypothetical protein